MFFSSFWSDGLTISHYSCFLNPHYLKIALNSLIIAFGTTFFSLLIGTPQAFLLQRTKVSWRNFFKVAYLILSFFISCFIERIKSLSNVLEYASLIPFAIPATVLGIGLIKVWNHSITQFVYDNSSIIILIAYIAHFIPFTTRIIISELKRISLEMEEAAFLISSNWFYVISMRLHNYTILLSRRINS